MKVLVIGAGASGLAAAIEAARLGAQVVVLEKMEKPGKKLLTTGNGRCNLSNRSIADGRAYYSREKETADQILKAFPAEAAKRFFEDLGLLIKSREGGLLYPYSDQAQSVLDVLLWEAARLKIKIKCREKVTEILPQNGAFIVKTETWQYEAQRVILAAGGKAAPVTGSDGSGYTLAASLGHKVIPVLPSLVPLMIKEGVFRSLEGVRSRAGLTLCINGKEQKKEIGELQWTSYGISGIVVFQISSLAVRAFKEGAAVEILIDLFPEYELTELLGMLRQRLEMESLTYERLFGGFFHKKILAALLKKEGLDPQETAEPKKAEAFLKKSKALCLTVTGSRSFEQAQVCSGGVSLKEVDGKTMESRLVKGLYLTGELLDVDGPCGGFNLQWAWASGFLAGRSAGKGET